MTYTILDGGVGRETAIETVVQAIQPDILILQEVFHDTIVRDLAQHLNMGWFAPSSNRRRRVALLSRLPIYTTVNYQRFPPIWRNIVTATIRCPSGALLQVCGLHLIANLAVPFEVWRSWEIRSLLQHIRPLGDCPCLIAGDFNAIAPGDRVELETMPPWLRASIWLQGQRVYHLAIQSLLRRHWTDCFRYLHPTNEGFTLPPATPNARLDYMFANSSLIPRLTQSWVVREPAAVQIASDHYPLVAEFDL